MNWSCWKIYASNMKFVYAVCIWICLSGFGHSAAYGSAINKHEGDKVTIACTPVPNSKNKKYFCRHPCLENDKDKYVKVSSDQTSNGRFGLKDYGNGTFTVTITDLRGSDSGNYWCRVELVDKEDPSEKVTLRVSKGVKSAITTYTTVTPAITTSGVKSAITNYTTVTPAIPTSGVKSAITNYTTVTPAIPTSGVKSAITNYTTVTPEITTSGVKSAISTYTTVTPAITTSGINCMGTSCIQNILDQIENITVLNLTNVTMFMDKVFSTSEKINTSSVDPNKLASDVLKASEKLVSMLVKPTNTYENVSFTRAAVEAQVFVVGQHANLDKIPQLHTSNASIEIDLIGIASNNLNSGSAAVAFMSYNTMEDLLKPDFFNTSDDTVKTMMSTVISATLPTTLNKTLTKPVNFTLKHIREINNSGNLSCVYWNISEWIVDGCSVVKTNSNFTVCSCLHLSTFALIMQTSRTSEDKSHPMEAMNVVFVIVGLVFTSLALLTFAFCQWKPGVNNVARINLCISLLSAHLLFLLTQQFINLIKPHKELCAVISGVLHFFFLSCFVWMFIEAVLLFICVKNISEISSKQRTMLNKGFLIVIGYAIDFVIVGVSAGVVPEGYGSEKCWIKEEKGIIWSFLGPVCFILAINTILFIGILISLKLSLKNLNHNVSHRRQTKITVFKILSQFLIFGCPWILGFFIHNSKMIEILFLILNSQQGTFIFIVFCVLNNEVRQQYVKWMRAVFPGLEPNTLEDAPTQNESISVKYNYR
ncbi:adhesion G protein-coupled receptor E3-like isoform X2 [Misgurnus anguillicaudatus]|uniref:adhesion G protein-coupled receptor E3-like isoform X2 n=1 Tax=Misgurnus anguillicaudatus TaxID=75329 RepID=UPI003CCF59D6